MTERFDQALLYAAQLHRKQVRKGRNIPYISHLLGVAALVLEYGGDEDEGIAALLHDAVEDIGADVAPQIRERFGERVLEIVEGCTDSRVIPKPPWEARKRAYIAHLCDAGPSIRLVCSADKLYNARTILEDYRQVGEQLWQRFRGGREGTLWYYREVTDALRRCGETPLIAELDRVVSELERLAGAAAEPRN
jgi:(p)ppGpp synthase/HD superfamily hydrolase